MGRHGWGRAATRTAPTGLWGKCVAQPTHTTRGETAPCNLAYVKPHSFRAVSPSPHCNKLRLLLQFPKDQHGRESVRGPTPSLENDHSPSAVPTATYMIEFRKKRVVPAAFFSRMPLRISDQLCSDRSLIIVSLFRYDRRSWRQ